MEVANVTLNPNDMGSGFTLNSNGLSVVSSGLNSGIRATHSKTSGKWYWEVKFDAGVIFSYIGVANKSFSLSSAVANNLNWRAYAGGNGYKYPESIAYGTTWTTGNILGIALDLDNGTLEFYKNGVSMGISHTNIKDLGEVYPTMVSGSTSAKTATFNFGATPFVYTVPSGFLAYAMYPSHKILISSEDEYYSVIPEVFGTETAVPKMTSNTAPSGRAFSSSESSSTSGAWRAFDRLDNGYVSAQGSGGLGYLGYEFVNPIRIGKYSVRSLGSSLTAMPRDWTFEASNDGANWTVLDAQVNQIWTATNTDKEFNIDINKINDHKMYRLNWTANGGYNDSSGGFTVLSELKMYEYIPSKILTLPNQSEQTFINHGMNKDSSIDLTASKVSERRYIVQDISQLGLGKVFRQKIDTSKILIKNAMVE